MRILREWGYTVDDITDEQLLAWSNLRPAADRAHEFNQLIADAEIGALIATWGGKNASDLLPFIDYRKVREARKPIVGSSDVAVILNAVASKSEIITFYGPNVLGKLNQTGEVGLPVLQGACKPSFQIPLTGSTDPTVVVNGTTSGRLVGGSLGTFTLGLAGTPYMPKFPATILFFESASLDVFGVRQHLQHLALTGLLQSVSGVCVGAMTQVRDLSKLDALLHEFFAPQGCPVVRCESFGHGDFLNPTIPIGARVQLTTNPCALTVQEAVVA